MDVETKRVVISQHFANAVQLLAKLFPLRYEDAKKNKTKAELEKQYKTLIRQIIAFEYDTELRVWFNNDCCAELLKNNIAQTLRLTLLAIITDHDNIEKINKNP